MRALTKNFDSQKTSNYGRNIERPTARPSLLPCHVTANTQTSPDWLRCPAEGRSVSCWFGHAREVFRLAELPSAGLSPCHVGIGKGIATTPPPRYIYHHWPAECTGPFLYALGINLCKSQMTTYCRITLVSVGNRVPFEMQPFLILNMGPSQRVGVHSTDPKLDL